MVDNSEKRPLTAIPYDPRKLRDGEIARDEQGKLYYKYPDGKVARIYPPECGKSVTSDGLPPGDNGDFLYHNSSDWIARNLFYNIDWTSEYDGNLIIPGQYAGFDIVDITHIKKYSLPDIGSDKTSETVELNIASQHAIHTYGNTFYLEPLETRSIQCAKFNGYCSVARISIHCITDFIVSGISSPYYDTWSIHEFICLFDASTRAPIGNEFTILNSSITTIPGKTSPISIIVSVKAYDSINYVVKITAENLLPSDIHGWNKLITSSKIEITKLQTNPGILTLNKW